MAFQISPKSFRTYKGNLKYNSQLTQFSRENRNKPTKMELLLWNMVLSKSKTGYPFLRQKVIGNYIVDFYCPKLLLAIEVDGASHNNKEDLDWKREEELKRLGLEIIHYEDEIIKTQLQTVYCDLVLKLKERELQLDQPNPSA
jgi:very-short-patch-repair endonuclease